MKKNNMKNKKKGDLVGIIRDNKKTALEARFNLNADIQAKTSTRKNAKKTVARAITALNLAKKQKIVDDSK